MKPSELLKPLEDRFIATLPPGQDDTDNLKAWHDVVDMNNKIMDDLEDRLSALEKKIS